MKKTLLLLLLTVNYVSFSQITIGSGTAVDSNAGLTTPISNWYNYSLSQTIYLASEINGSGMITSVEFPLNNSNSLTNSDGMIDMWIGHTTKSSFENVVGTNGADVVDVATLTQVMTNGTLTKVGSNTIYTLMTPFEYNGTDNLIIVVDANEPSNDGSSILYLQSATPEVRCIMIRSDTGDISATNPPLNFTNTNTTSSWQAKMTRAIITINGLTELSIAENELTSLSIYPNPVKDILHIQARVDIAKVELYNVAGQLIFEQSESDNINISSLSNGFYIVKIMDTNGHFETKKILKQ